MRELEDKESEIAAIQKEFDALMDRADLGSSSGAFLDVITGAIERMKKSLDSLEVLRRQLVITDDTDLLEMQSKIDEAHVMVADVLRQEGVVSELKSLETRVAAVTKEDRDYGDQLARAMKAVEAIASLLSEASLAKRLEYFLRGNAGVVRDMFLRVHSPREFIDVSIGVDAICLRRADGSVEV